MNLFAFALCFIAVPCAYGNNSPQNLLEIDRARSSWNFGGHQPIKKSTYWNRPKNVAGPGSILANRRMGSGSAPMAPYRKISQTPSGASQKRRQNKPYARAVQQGRSITKRHTNFPFPSQPGAPFLQPHSMSYFNSQQQRTPSSPWHRSSRKLSPSVDTIKSRFMKEDLWHLDKGESYVVKDEDLERDSALRNRHYESNDIDGENFSALDEEVLHHQQLETEAEDMVNQAEKGKHSDVGKDSTTQHIHHHHHYEVEGSEKQPAKPDANKVKHAAPSQVVAAPLPRIHNPIPLGCLLAVPVFHPIRPRHHLACLLSIPGTPSLSKRRRRRSADSPAIQIPTSSQSQSFLQQLFGGSNSKMTPIVTRKHYASHVGNGKNPGSSASTQQSPFKVPASIIVPPTFDQEDILSMLLGSGGVSVDKMGAIVATNNRYVRYGRGLPNGQSTRQGRHINWPSAKHMPQSSAPTPMQTTVNHMPSATKLPLPAKKPLVHLTPFPKKSPVYAPQNSYYPSNVPQAPFILNVQISPSPVTRPSSGPVINVPIQHQSQQPHHHEHHQHSSNNEQQNQHSEPEHHHDHEHHHHHYDHSHYEEQHLPTTEQPQEQPTAESHSQPQQQSSTEEKPSTISSEQEQQATSEDQHQDQLPTVEEKTPTASYQTVTVSPSDKSHAFETYTNTQWMPVSTGKSKPQKAYYYEYANSNPEPLESKALYRKVKPFTFPQEKELDSESSYYYENINDQLADSGVTGTDSLSDYYNVLNVYGSADKAAYLKGKAYWQDVANEVSNGNVAYAVKKNYKDELDNVLQGIASRERGIYSDVGYYPESNDVYDNISINQFGGSYVDSDNSAYSQEKYYTVKKLPTQVPDPIYVSVPKEDEFSNELYDVKK